TESAYLLFDMDLWMNSGAGKFGWCTFMKLMLMKNGWFGFFAASSRKLSPDCSTYLSMNGMPTTPLSGVSTYWPLTLKSSCAFSPDLPDIEPLVTLLNMARSFGSMSGNHVSSP